MTHIPVITGIGLVTPLGNSAAETFDALLAGRHIRDHARTALDNTTPDRIHRLAAAAAAEALGDAGWDDHPIESRRTAVVAGTSKGAVEAWLPAPPRIYDEAYVPAGARHVVVGLADIAARIRETFPLLDGPSLTCSAACASGLHAAIRAAMMIRSGEADRVLVVAAEASVHPLFLTSFDRLGVLPREGVGCRPFDCDRDGFLMSEAAAAVCLEAAETDDASRPPQTYARVERFAVAGDAVNMTAGDPDGAVLRNMLGRVLGDRPVDLIHAHGTGTRFNDPIELSAYDEFVGEGSSPVLYSHKGALGHSLGAAGLISVTLNGMIHARGVVPPNAQTRNPLAATRVRISSGAVEQPTRRSIAMAAGFGGPTGMISLVSA